MASYPPLTKATGTRKIVGMTNDTTPTYTNDGNENPYTVFRILQATAHKLQTVDSLIEAITNAMAEVAPDVCDPGEHFAMALDVAVNAGSNFVEAIASQPWGTRYRRSEQLLAEAYRYAAQLCPALANQVPRI